MPKLPPMGSDHSLMAWIIESLIEIRSTVQGLTRGQDEIMQQLNTARVERTRLDERQTMVIRRIDKLEGLREPPPPRPRLITVMKEVASIREWVLGGTLVAGALGVLEYPEHVRASLLKAIGLE